MVSLDELSDTLPKTIEGCIYCKGREAISEKLNSLEEKYQKQYEDTLRELSVAQIDVLRLREELMHTKEKEKTFELNISNKNDSAMKASQSSFRMKHSGLFDQENLSQELVQKIVKLEESNKRLKRKMRYMSKEMDDKQSMYGERLEMLYTTCVALINNQ